MVGTRQSRSCLRNLSGIVSALKSNVAGPSRQPTACLCRRNPTTATRNYVGPPLSFRRIPQGFATRTFTSSPVYSQEEAASSAQTVTLDTVADSLAESEQQISLITGEAIGAIPTLAHLDSLRPRPRQARHGPYPLPFQMKTPFMTANRQPSEKEREWEKTKNLVMSSFTRAQLISLAREAGVSVNSSKVKKETLARRLMVERFGMVDAQEQMRLAREEALDQSSQFVSFEPAQLFLLLSEGSVKVREQAKKARVNILPQVDGKQAETPALGFWIRGRSAGIAQMTQWTESFKQTVQTRQEEIILTDPSAASNAGTDASNYLPPELSQTISRLSRCFVSVGAIQDDRLAVTLAYTDAQNAERATLMLRQFQSGILQQADNVGGAAFLKDQDSLRQYSMLPIVSPEPTWIKQAEDVLTVSNTEVAFRVAHVPEHGPLAIASSSSLPQMELAGWQASGDVNLAEPFQALQQLATERHMDTTTLHTEHKAMLGHVLFSGNALTFADENTGEEELLQKLQDPLASPRPAFWPLEHMTSWSRRFRNKWAKEASHFSPTTFFRSQKNFMVEVWLDRHGWGLTDEQSDVSTEQILLTYHDESADSNARPQLEIRLIAVPGKDIEDGTWTVDSIRWVSRIEAPVMVPERSVDIQLSSQTWTPITGESASDIQTTLLPYLQDILTGKSQIVEQSDLETVQGRRAAALASASHTLSLPPSQLQIESIGTMQLHDAKRVLVQTYYQRPDSKAPRFSEITQARQDEYGEGKELLTLADVGFQMSEATPEDASASADPQVSSAASDSIDPSKPSLVREITQDSITGATRESLSVVWTTSPGQAAPSWESTVHTISSLIENHGQTIR